MLIASAGGEVSAVISFDQFFSVVTGYEPFPYQKRIAEEGWPDALNVPTGLGKTAAVTVAWLYKRLKGDEAAPRRLVWCLPMRVLVEQVRENVDGWLVKAAPIFVEAGLAAPRAYTLMGGEADHRWTEHPEEAAILVGTQDMLLSRALMRGYGMRRYSWPVHFALLHNDAFWVFDEVQLMGPGLATAAQLEAFRSQLGVGIPSRTLWVSATFSSDWLETVDLRPYLSDFACLELGAEEVLLPEVRARREAVKRLVPLDVGPIADTRAAIDAYARALAEAVVNEHQPGTQSLVIVNTVERAQSVIRALQHRTGADVELTLIHSRFRATERQERENQVASLPGAAGRIVVATQAVEAGVDISSRTLFTELAPWASLVQRFGRCNRYGEWNENDGAAVFWIDLPPALANPYEAEELETARGHLRVLNEVAPSALPPIDEPAHHGLVLRRRDLLDLFNTDPDLSGFDVDVSPYIRDADETEVQVFWRDFTLGVDGRPKLDGQPQPWTEELCRASLRQFKAYWDRVRKHGGHVFAWDQLEGKWRAVERVRPGQVLMLDACMGGYDPLFGFTPTYKGEVEVVMPPDDVATVSSSHYEADARSFIGRAVALTRHLLDVENAAASLCIALNVCQPEARAVTRAARWHDVGKSHEAFQNMLWASAGQAAGSRQELLAKSGRRTGGGTCFVFGPKGERVNRPYFRHELASALAWLECHDGIPDADLIAYLIAAHHGKVRLGLRAQPGEAEPPETERFYARGIWAGDRLPGLTLPDKETVPEVELRLDLMRLGSGPQGPSWADRTQRLLSAYGPFRLAWLETLVRIADWRASELEQELEDA